MSTHRWRRSARGVAGWARRLFGVFLRRDTYANVAYVLLAFPLGLGYFITFTIGLSLGIGLTVILVGFIVLALTFGLGLTLGSLERRLNNWLLGTDLGAKTELAGDGLRDRGKALLLDVRSWTPLLYLPVKFALGLIGFVWLFTASTTAIAMVTVPLYYDRPGVYVGIVSDRAPEIHQTIQLGWNYMLVGFEAAFTLGYWEIDTLPQALLVGLLGLVLLGLTLHVVNGLAAIWIRFARAALDGGYDPLGFAWGGDNGA